MTHILRTAAFCVIVFAAGNRFLSAQENETKAADAAATSAAAAQGDQTNINLVRFFDSELFSWNYTLFGGLTLNYRQHSSSTAWGLNPVMKDALLSYPDTKKHVKSYTGFTVSGHIFLWGGLAAILASCFVPMIMNDIPENYGNPHDRGGVEAPMPTSIKIMIGGMVGGYVSVLAGSWLSGAGQEKIFQAVNAFNRQKIGEWTGQ